MFSVCYACISLFDPNSDLSSGACSVTLMAWRVLTMISVANVPELNFLPLVENSIEGRGKPSTDSIMSVPSSHLEQAVRRFSGFCDFVVHPNGGRTLQIGIHFQVNRALPPPPLCGPQRLWTTHVPVVTLIMGL